MFELRADEPVSRSPVTCVYKLRTISNRFNMRVNSQAAFYPFSLAAQAEGADGPRLLRPALPLRVNRAEARLLVGAVPEKEHVGQMWDVAGGQSKSFDFGELPVHRLGGYESPESRERGVDALGPASLPGVCCAPLLHDHPGVAVQLARSPSSFRAGAAVALLRAAVAFAAVFVILGRGS